MKNLELFCKKLNFKELYLLILISDGTTIKAISENVVVNPGEDAMLSCTVEGKPLTEEHIKWERVAYDMTVKTTTSFVNGTSYLHIKDARREDVGNFQCIADNRVANPTNRDVLLIVKCKCPLIVFIVDSKYTFILLLCPMM